MKSWYEHLSIEETASVVGHYPNPIGKSRALLDRLDSPLCILGWVFRSEWKLACILSCLWRPFNCLGVLTRPRAGLVAVILFVFADTSWDPVLRNLSRRSRCMRLSKCAEISCILTHQNRFIAPLSFTSTSSWGAITILSGQLYILKRDFGYICFCYIVVQLHTKNSAATRFQCKCQYILIICRSW